MQEEIKKYTQNVISYHPNVIKQLSKCRKKIDSVE